MEGDWNRRSLVGEFLVVLVEKIERGEEDEETIEAEELRVSMAMERKRQRRDCPCKPLRYFYLLSLLTNSGKPSNGFSILVNPM